MRILKFRFYDIKITKKMIYQDPIEAKDIIFNQWESTPKCSPIMQYTGLTDKNGVDIYEGDILKCHYQTNGFVFYLDGSYHVSSDQVSLDYENHTTYDNLNNNLILDNNLSVIGNRYENPDLLNA